MSTLPKMQHGIAGTRLLTGLVAATLFMLTACSKKSQNPTEDADHAAITTVILSFKQAGVVKYEAVFDDPDGVGGNPPVRYDAIELQRGSTYDMDITLQNKQGGTTKDMTASIRNAGRFHEFFFIPAGVTVNITKNDKDTQGNPLGFNSTWVTQPVAGTGTLQLKLQHMLLKKEVNQPTDGHSDININFALQIN